MSKLLAGRKEKRKGGREKGKEEGRKDFCPEYLKYTPIKIHTE